MGNPIVHWELVVGDLDKAREFYTNVFQWNVETMPDFPGYPGVDPGAPPKGAMYVKSENDSGFALNVYFAVDNVEQTLTRAVGAGGTLLVPETAVDGMGEYGMFADPDGIRIGVFHEK